MTAAVAVLAIGLGSGVCSPASATTSVAMTDAHTRPPSPLAVLISPLTVGVHIIEALAQDIANAVEYIATPAPIEIPAPHTST